MDDAASCAASALSQGSGLGGIVNMPAVLEDALAEMNAKLRRQPSKILPLLQVLRTQDVSTKKRKAQCDTKLAFNSTYCKFEKIPLDFAEKVIAAGSNGALTVEDVQAAERCVRGTTKKLLFFGIGATEQCRWPKAAHDRDVCESLLLVMHYDMGEPWSKCRVLRPRQNVALVDWDHYGYFTLLCAEGDNAATDVYTRVRHNPSGRVVALHGLSLPVQATNGQGLFKNDLEQEAFVKVGPITLTLSMQLFAEDMGAWPSVICSERANNTTMKIMGKVAELIPVLEKYGLAHVVQMGSGAAMSSSPGTPFTTPEQNRSAPSLVGSPVRPLALPPC
eukprot:2841480-Amphidinium_carterae.1